MDIACSVKSGSPGSNRGRFACWTSSESSSLPRFLSGGWSPAIILSVSACFSVQLPFRSFKDGSASGSAPARSRMRCSKMSSLSGEEAQSERILEAMGVGSVGRMERRYSEDDAIAVPPTTR